jgi:hypothetical protein
MKVAEKNQSPYSSLVGSVRRFGKNGVLYEVLRQVDDASVLIRVLDTDEETPYPIADALKDPNE